MDLAAPANRAGRDAHFGASWNICHRVSPISEGPVAVLASPSDWLRAPTPSASVNWIRFSGSRLHRPPLNRLASGPPGMGGNRSEEHTSELQSLLRISYAAFCLTKKNTTRVE